MNRDNRPECSGERPPEKIYLQWNPEDSNGSTWCADRIDDSDIEYTRHTEQPEGWVSVKDKLPKDMMHVFCYMNDGQRRFCQFVGGKFILMLYKTDDDKWIERLKPTHWQPLPKPPEEE